MISLFSKGKISEDPEIPSINIFAPSPSIYQYKQNLYPRSQAQSGTDSTNQTYSAKISINPDVFNTRPEDGSDNPERSNQQGIFFKSEGENLLFISLCNLSKNMPYDATVSSFNAQSIANQAKNKGVTSEDKNKPRALQDQMTVDF